MLSFELSAIDIILVLAVLVLLLLYWTKLSKLPEEKTLTQPTAQKTKPKETTKTPQNDYTECPRGFGYIKGIENDGSVSERCLGCYRIMDCYGESEKVGFPYNQSNQ
jgi:hypothetical protein